MTCCDCLRHIVIVNDMLCLSMTHCDCQWHVMSVYDTLWLSMTCCNCLWHIVIVKDMLCLSMTHCDCQWHVVIVYDTLWLSMTHCYCYDCYMWLSWLWLSVTHCDYCLQIHVKLVRRSYICEIVVRQFCPNPSDFTKSISSCSLHEQSSPLNPTVCIFYSDYRGLCKIYHLKECN